MNQFKYLAFSLLLLGCDEPQPSSTIPEVETKESSQAVDSLIWFNDQILKEPENDDLYFKRGMYKFRIGEALGGQADVDRALKIDSMNGEYLLAKAAFLFDKGSYQESKQWMERAMERDPEYLPAYLKLADMYLLTQNYDELYVVLNKALEVDVNHAPAYFKKGLAYKEQGKFKNATTNFQTAVEQDNEMYAAWVQLGLMYAMAKDELAIDYYNNAILLDSTNPEALYNKAYYLQETNRATEAIEVYAQIIRHQPTHLNAWYNTGYVQMVMLDEYQEAINSFNKVIGQNPAAYKAIYNRGLCYEELENYEMAQQDFQASLSINPTFTLAAQSMERLDRKGK